MTFPLYNECPNCGCLLVAHHSDARGNHWAPNPKNLCECTLNQSDVAQSISIQAAVEVALQRAGVGNLGGPADEGEIKGGYHSCDGPCCEKRPGEYCADDDCNCGAGGNHATLPRYDLHSGLFATPAHRLQGAVAADIGKPVKLVSGKYEFCEKSEAEGSLYGFSTIHKERCAVIDTSILK